MFCSSLHLYDRSDCSCCPLSSRLSAMSAMHDGTPFLKMHYGKQRVQYIGNYYIEIGEWFRTKPKRVTHDELLRLYRLICDWMLQMLSTLSLLPGNGADVGHGRKALLNTGFFDVCCSSAQLKRDARALDDSSIAGTVTSLNNGSSLKRNESWDSLRFSEVEGAIKTRQCSRATVTQSVLKWFSNRPRAWNLITMILQHVSNTHTPTQDSICAQSPSVW